MSRAQRTADLLRWLDAHAIEAGHVLRAATPGPVKRYQVPGYVHPSSISRQRQGDISNPVHRMAATFVAIVRAGGGRLELERILAHLTAVAHELTAEYDDLLGAWEREQLADGEEDLAQLAAAVGRDDAVRLDAYIAAAESHVAAELAAIAAARARRTELRMLKAA